MVFYFLPDHYKLVDILFLINFQAMTYFVGEFKKEEKKEE